MLERIFGLGAHGTSVRGELLAGLTTFLTMAYIVFVNPEILAAAGVPKEAAFVATCLAAAFGSLLMAFIANVPVAIAPGMGLNAFFAYVVVVQMHYSWQAALGCVFLSGCLFVLVTVTGVREAIVGGVPRSLRIAITAGIGLFLAIIALKSAGLVAASPATFVTLGDLHEPGVILAALGFLCVAGLSAWGFRGALLAGILAVTALSFVFAGNVFQGVFAAPPSIAPTLFALDIPGALSGGLINVILVFFMVELFDATGTLIAVAGRAGLMREKGDRRLSRALLADSLSIPVGAMLGTSSTTAYLESAAGVAAGGRTGLTAATVAALFLLCLFFAPLAGSAPAYATAPALLYVACLMLRDIAELDWDDVTEWAPACVAALAMPFTYSIANGVACGFIGYAALKLVTGRAREAKPVVWIVAALFLLRYAVMPAG
ncbi:NCS2 family permease [Hansschlegelia beijingensis]|uniref:AGZA family xanthine/uracil permease-like MFS transporter n=1 Tax=Hansschlegelia beijingensis TaxID=1133344 RepID=A0A7W6D3A9_9HYPH|nr:NCS2 family permease [Hansschlegelia beijingensis]MBB3973781.1 AGZA family xanthine/uracil permease-like MFS transporter [Hansschlegelia beijingensis]